MIRKMKSDLNARNRVYIISRGNRWAICKENCRKASRIYDDKTVAICVARLRFLLYDLIVHRKDGTVESWNEI